MWYQSNYLVNIKVKLPNCFHLLNVKKKRLFLRKNSNLKGKLKLRKQLRLKKLLNKQLLLKYWLRLMIWLLKIRKTKGLLRQKRNMKVLKMLLLKIVLIVLSYCLLLSKLSILRILRTQSFILLVVLELYFVKKLLNVKFFCSLIRSESITLWKQTFTWQPEQILSLSIAVKWDSDLTKA